MNYELAKQLKDAGFRQTGDNESRYGGLKKAYAPIDENYTSDLNAYVPTLEELIEACGERFNSMGGDVRTKEWWAAERPEGLFVETFPLRCTGSTPTEAVAYLYLALNKKEAPSRS